MPSQLSTPNTQVRRLNREKATRLDPMQSVDIRWPLMGYIPDIDPNKLPFTAASDVSNIRARALPETGVGGEFLVVAPGYEQVRPISIDILGTGLRGLVGRDTGATVGSDAGAAGEIIALGSLHRTTGTGATSGTSDITSLAVVSKAGSDTYGGLYRIDDSDTWDNCQPEVAADGLLAPLDGNISGTWVNSMPHMVAYPGGNSSHSSTLGQNVPIMVICTTSNDVLFWPTSNTEHPAGFPTYERLDETDGGAVFTKFMARTAAYWNGRMYFLNTNEDIGAGNVFHRRRIRRTAIGDASAFSAPGSGARDIREFEKDGVRLEPLGEVLACYFEDGVGFLRATHNASNPDEWETVTQERGLLSTHGVVDVGNNVHFGIFTDGWYFLSANGEWSKVGQIPIDGVPLDRWQTTFYRNLDFTNRHRIQVKYVTKTNEILITYPRTNGVEETWIYDINTDRVWIDDYPVTCFGTYTQNLRSELVAEDLESGDEVPLGWESFFTLIDPALVSAADPALFTRDVLASEMTIAASATGNIKGIDQIVHGNKKGLVYIHHDSLTFRGDDDIPTNATTEPTFLFETGLRNIEAASLYTTLDRVKMEYVNYQPVSVPNSDTVVTAYCNSSATTQSFTMNLNQGAANSIHSTWGWFRFTSVAPGLRISGTSPVAIRAITLNIMLHGDEAREV